MIRKFYRLLKPEEIPRDRDSQEFKDFWKEERRRCKEGMYLGDVFISGLLYYFWNHYWMRIDKSDGSFEYTRPWMREVEIMSIGDYVKCLEERICYTLFGTRQSGKTEVMCAITQWYYGIHKNTRSLILYPIEDKWKSFEEKLKESVKAALLDNPDNACIPHYIDADWNKKEIRWAFKSLMLIQ